MDGGRGVLVSFVFFPGYKIDHKPGFKAVIVEVGVSQAERQESTCELRLWFVGIED